MKLMIFGYARHGKDTASELFTKNFGLTSMSSSRFSTERIMIPYFEKKGVFYDSAEACYEDRVNRREEWFRQTRAYNDTDLALLGRQLYSQYDIYTGCRSREEFYAMLAEGLFDYSIWVDRSKHLGVESSASSEMLPDMADFILDNNGTLEELEERVCGLYVTMEHYDE
jgi:hypothetical protein